MALCGLFLWCSVCVLSCLPHSSLAACKKRRLAQAAGHFDGPFGRLYGPARPSHVDAQDLFGVAGPGPSSTTPSSDGYDSLAGLGFGAAQLPPAAGGQQGTPTSYPSVTVFEKDGVSVSFAFAKPPGQPGAVDIAATYSNAGPSPVTGFTLQVHQSLCRVAPL